MPRKGCTQPALSKLVVHNARYIKDNGPRYTCFNYRAGISKKGNLCLFVTKDKKVNYIEIIKPSLSILVSRDGSSNFRGSLVLKFLDIFRNIPARYSEKFPGMKRNDYLKHFIRKFQEKVGLEEIRKITNSTSHRQYLVINKLKALRIILILKEAGISFPKERIQDLTGAIVSNNTIGQVNKTTKQVLKYFARHEINPTIDNILWEIKYRLSAQYHYFYFSNNRFFHELCASNNIIGNLLVQKFYDRTLKKKLITLSKSKKEMIIREATRFGDKKTSKEIVKITNKIGNLNSTSIYNYRRLSSNVDFLTKVGELVQEANGNSKYIQLLAAIGREKFIKFINSIDNRYSSPYIFSLITNSVIIKNIDNELMYELVEDTKKLIISLDIDYNITVDYPTKITSINQLKNWHDKLTEQLNEQLEKENLIKKFLFPMMPPLPETPFLKALSCPLDIIKEGKAMHHCVGGYASDPFKCGSFFYHFDNNEEKGTVMVRRLNNQWVIQQAYSVCNNPLSENVWNYLRQWEEQQ